MSFKAFYLRTKFWLNDWLKGSPIGRQYREIKYIQEHSAAAGEPLRRKALENILSYAQTNTKFYSKFSSLKLEDYPVMNKSMLIAHADEINVDPSKIPNQEGPLYVQKTSGSTGTPFTILHDTRKRQRRIAELKYFGKIVGFRSHDELVQLRAWNRFQSKTVQQGNRENIVPFDISRMGQDDMAELFAIIRKTHAKCLRSYASSFKIIAEYARQHPETQVAVRDLRIAIAGSEMLEDAIRPLYKKYMHGDIISQYANEECGILAQERVPTSDSDNVMYINHASYFFEVLKMDRDEPAGYGELGRIVLTDLHNLAFPLIRYDNGDVGMLLPPNEYSRGYPILGKLFGRRLDLIYSTSGAALHPMAIGREMKHYDDVAQWQFIQKEEAQYELRICLREEGGGPAVSSRVIQPLKNILGEDAVINVVVVDDIPVLASGKRKMVVNERKR